MLVVVCLMLAAGPIGGVEIDLRVRNCLDSVVSAFYNQLDVSRSEAIHTLKLLADSCEADQNMRTSSAETGVGAPGPPIWLSSSNCCSSLLMLSVYVLARSYGWTLSAEGSGRRRIAGETRLRFAPAKLARRGITCRLVAALIQAATLFELVSQVAKKVDCKTWNVVAARTFVRLCDGLVETGPLPPRSLGTSGLQPAFPATRELVNSFTSTRKGSKRPSETDLDVTRVIHGTR